MSVFFMTGFDLFGSSAIASASGGALDRPADGAGLINHPGRPTYTAYNAIFNAGVSGLAQYRFGAGATLRNTLQCWTIGVQNGTNTVTFPLAASTSANIGSGAIRSAGFRVKRSAARPGTAIGAINAAYTLATFGTTSLGYIPGATATSGQLRIGASSDVIFRFNEDQEYYVEMVLTRQAATTTWELQVFVDGVRIVTPAAVTVISPTFTVFTLGSAGGNYQWNCAWCFGDLYVSDARLGPQVVLSRQPSAVIESNWTPSEGSDPLALITGAAGNDDAKYIRSPMGVEQDRYRMDFELREGYKANAANAFVRGRREPTSTRKLDFKLVNNVTGEQVAPAGTLVGDFTQQAWRTDQLWSTDKPEDLTRANVNNLVMTLAATLT